MDPDPQGFTFIFPRGSGSACPGGENLREKTEKMKGKWKKIVILL